MRMVTNCHWSTPSCLACVASYRIPEERLRREESATAPAAREHMSYPPARGLHPGANSRMRTKTKPHPFTYYCAPTALRMHSALPSCSRVDSCCHNLPVPSAVSAVHDPQYRTSPSTSSEGLPPQANTNGTIETPG
eukprot:10937018-Karenia_brevis.AAC.1